VKAAQNPARSESKAMSLETIFMLGLILATLLVFALEIFPIEVTALGLLAVLLATGLVSADQALKGLSNKAVVTVGCMFVLSHALVKTGLLEILENKLSDNVRQRAWLAVAVLLCSVGLLSGFLNNTAVVAIFIPLAMSLCRRFSLSPSKVLIPLSYVSMLGGTLTLIGTSTNLLVSSIAEQAGQRPWPCSSLRGWA
jgi:Na+/H+ antiporter NhaD/arsenite permease-like protein